MTASQSKHAANDADCHCVEGACHEQGSRGLGDAMRTRPRVLVVTAADQVSCPLYHALESEYEVSRSSSLDDPLDDLLRDADVALVDWTALGRNVLNTAYEDRKHDTWADLPVSVDLKAVRRLGTILKSLSVGSRARRRRNS